MKDNVHVHRYDMNCTRNSVKRCLITRYERFVYNVSCDQHLKVAHSTIWQIPAVSSHSITKGIDI
jgi:hypothetical protein